MLQDKDPKNLKSNALRLTLFEPENYKYKYLISPKINQEKGAAVLNVSTSSGSPFRQNTTSGQLMATLD